MSSTLEDVPVLPSTSTEVGTATIKFLVSPVPSVTGRLLWDVTQQPSGQLVSSYIEGGAIQVQLNSEFLAPDQWDKRIVNTNDELIIFPMWEAQAVPFIVAFVISTAISIGLSYIFRPASLEAAEPFDQTYGFSGVSSTRGRGGPVPWIYGERRVGIRTISSEVVYESTLIDDGSTEAPLSIADVTGGNNLGDGDFDDPVLITVQTSVDHGYTNGDTVTISGVEGKTRTNGQWRIVTSGLDSFTLSNSGGIDGTAYVPGTGIVTTQGLRSYTATDDNARFNILGALCQGEIEEIPADLIEINNQPIGNHPEVTVVTDRRGQPGQLPIPGFDEFRESLPDNHEFTELNNEHLYTTSRAIDAFVLNIDFRQGLSHLSDRGARSDNTVDIRYRYKVPGPGNPWLGERTIRIRGRKNGPLRYGIRRENIQNNTYEIGVTLMAARQQNATSTWKPTLTTVTEVVAATESYPNTALVAVRGVASADIQGAIPNITAVVKGRKVRVGSFAATATYSSSPAWCGMDLLTQGFGYPDTAINLPAFAAVAAICSEQVEGADRHSCHYVIDTRQSEQQVLGALMEPSGMEMLYTYGQYTPFIPRATDQPVQVFSWASTRSSQFQGGLDTEGINVIEVQFPDEDEGGQQNVITWPTEENQPANPRVQSIQIRSVTSRAEVIRVAQRLLNKRRLETETGEFETLANGFYAQKGDVVGISSTLLGIGEGGRVNPEATSTATLLQLDRPVTLTVGKVYHAYVKHPNGTLDDVDVVNSGTTTSALTLSEAMSVVPADADTEWVLGEKTPIETAVELYRVEDVILQDTSRVRVQVKIHNPSIYTDPVGVPLPVITTFPEANAPPPPLTSLTVEEVRQLLPSGNRQSYVQLEWDVAPRGDRTAPYGGVTILRRQTLSSAGLGTAGLAMTSLGTSQNADDVSNTGWEELPTVTGSIFQATDFTVIEGATYTYRVIPCSSRGVKNNVGWIERTITISGARLSSNAPGPPRNLDLFVLSLGGEWIDTTDFDPEFFGVTEAEFMGRDIQFRWEAPTTGDPDIIGYRIRITDDKGLYVMREVLVGIQNDYPYYHADNIEDALRLGLTSAVRGVKFYIWARTAELESVNPAFFTAINPAPDMSLIAPEVISAPETALIKWTQYEAPRDAQRFDVYADMVSPPRRLDHTITGITKQTALYNLQAGDTMYVQIAAHDDFAPTPEDKWSQIVQFVVGAFPSEIDQTPPLAPNNPVLSQIITEQPDGTQIISVRAVWTSSQVPLPDWTHQVDISLDGGITTLSTVLIGPEQVYQWDSAPGSSNVSIRVGVRKPLAAGPFSDWVTITTTFDNTELPAPTGLSTESVVKGNVIYFDPVAAGTGYKHTEVWAAPANDRGQATLVGTTTALILHPDLVPLSNWWYWARHVNTSGVEGTWSSGTTAGLLQQVTQTATFLDTLLADNIIASTVQVLLQLGVGNLIQLDGAQGQIVTRYAGGEVATIQGLISASPAQHGFVVFNEAGNIMFQADAGGITTFGVQTGAITANHLVTNTAVITDTLQFANGVVTNLNVDNLAVNKIKIANGAITSSIETASSSEDVTRVLPAAQTFEEELLFITIPTLSTNDGINASEELEIYCEVEFMVEMTATAGEIDARIELREGTIAGNTLGFRKVGGKISSIATSDVQVRHSVSFTYREVVTADQTNRRLSMTLQHSNENAVAGVIAYSRPYMKSTITRK